MSLNRECLLWSLLFQPHFHGVELKVLSQLKRWTFCSSDIFSFLLAILFTFACWLASMLRRTWKNNPQLASWNCFLVYPIDPMKINAEFPVMHFQYTTINPFTLVFAWTDTPKSKIWWDTLWHINRYKQINDTLFRQRITAESATDL